MWRLVTEKVIGVLLIECLLHLLTETGEAKRMDDKYSYVSAWQYKDNADPYLNKEKLVFENVKLAERSYK